MRNFIIDTDTASDDAVAIVMALRQPDIDVKAITVVAGNAPLPQAVQNALYTVELCGADTPVYAGCAKPLLRDLETAQDVHGRDGMGDIGLPLQGRTAAAGHAADTLRALINAHAGDITLVTLGPLTNVALALLREPELARCVSHCWIMGGIGSGHGNVTPTAEFNIWVDPEAAKIVYESGMNMTMVGWDISWKYATFDADQAAEIRGIGTPLAEFVIDIQATLTEFSMTENALPGFDLPDPITMAAAIDPSIAEYRDYRVDVTTGNGLERGITVVDVLGVTKRAPQMRVATSADRAAFVNMLKRSVS
ncbi:MAG: nucleoside hydrolase [Chloroflexota bacterium]|nr:nucleoside hydrolase [Chloroflexota bacterium]